MVCASRRPRYQLNVYMAIGPLVTFMSRINLMLGLVEHVKVTLRIRSLVWYA